MFKLDSFELFNSLEIKFKFEAIFEMRLRFVHLFNIFVGKVFSFFLLVDGVSRAPLTARKEVKKG